RTIDPDDLERTARVPNQSNRGHRSCRAAAYDRDAGGLGPARAIGDHAKTKVRMLGVRLLLATRHSDASPVGRVIPGTAAGVARDFLIWIGSSVGGHGITAPLEDVTCHVVYPKRRNTAGVHSYRNRPRQV